MTNINPSAVTLVREDGLYFTPENDFVIQPTTDHPEARFLMWRIVNGESVSNSEAGYMTLADARHDIALERAARAGWKPADGSEGPSRLAAMFPLR